MITVKEIHKTSTACPSQWEGWTDDNRQIYVRYRWGYLSVSVGKVDDKTEMAAVDGEEIFSYINNREPLGGYMTYTALKRLTKSAIKFPAKESNARRNN